MVAGEADRNRRLARMSKGKFACIEEVTVIGHRDVTQSVCAAMLIGVVSAVQAQDAGVGPKASPPVTRDCKSLAEQIAAAFPGADMRQLYGGERWVVYLPEDNAIQVPCMKKGISLVLAEVKGPASAAADRLVVADRSAEIFSGPTMTGGAAKCLRAVKRTQKRAGKVGRSHVREINAIPHFEGEIVLGDVTVFCRYDYDSKKELVLFYDLAEK